MMLVCKGLRPDQKNWGKRTTKYVQKTDRNSFLLVFQRTVPWERGAWGGGGGRTLISLQSNLNDCNS